MVWNLIWWYSQDKVCSVAAGLIHLRSAFFLEDLCAEMIGVEMVLLAGGGLVHLRSPFFSKTVCQDDAHWSSIWNDPGQIPILFRKSGQVPNSESENKPQIYWPNYNNLGNPQAHTTAPKRSWFIGAIDSGVYVYKLNKYLHYSRGVTVLLHVAML